MFVDAMEHINITQFEIEKKTLQKNSKVHNQKTFVIFEIQKQKNSSHKQKHGECFKQFQHHNVSHFHLG
jgi:hypothetical protein